MIIILGFSPSLVAQLVKNPPAVQETGIRFLGWEDLLEKGKYSFPSEYPVFWPREFTKNRTRLSDFHFSVPRWEVMAELTPDEADEVER